MMELFLGQKKLSFHVLHCTHSTKQNVQINQKLTSVEARLGGLHCGPERN